MPNKLKIKSTQRKKVVPLGELIEGTREDTIPKVEQKFKHLQDEGIKFEFYLVGDIVAEDILKNEFLQKFVKVCIIDKKTQRDQVDIEIEEFFTEILELKNPKGTIAEDSWKIIQQSIDSDNKVLIHVIEGEEDLLVLPLIMRIHLEKKESFVFYGQPPVTDSEPPISQGNCRS
jgi:uncharacterized protein (UPF0218 family)